MIMVYKDDNLEKVKKHVEKSSLSKKNKEDIFKFINQIAAEGLSKTRQQKYMYILTSIGKMITKDFQDLMKNDIVNLCAEINNSKLAEWTKHDRLVAIKRFMKFIYQEKEDKKKNGKTYGKGEYPDCVKWITTTIKNNRKKKPEDLLNEEDVKKLANHSNNLRDRALILVMYESAARIGELQGIKVKHVDFDKFGCKIKVHGKTGDRTIRLISSAPSISNWLTDHPNKSRSDFRDSYLFCSLWGKNRGEYVSYAQLNLLLKEIARKSNISKPVNPHHFRHSRATELAKRLTESQLCEYMGWVQGSKEASTYVHLSGRDTDKAILSMYGLAEEDLSQDKLQPIKCPRCKIKNDPAAKFCSGCSLGLDEKSVMEYDKKKELAIKTGLTVDEMMNDPEILKQMINIFSEKLEKKLQEK